MVHGKLAALLALLLAPGAHALQVDFDSIASGTLLDDEYQSSNNAALDTGEGFTITTTNNAGPDWAALYDTGLSGGEDPDIEGPPGTNWVGGNLSSPQTATGNLVIIQEWVSPAEDSAGQLTAASGSHPSQGSGAGGQNAPDDDASGGTISFLFESSLSSLGFIWVDLDDPTGAGYSIDFTDTTSGTTVNLAMNDFVNAASPFYDSSVVWGDSHANTIDLITADELALAFGVNLTQFDQVDFNLSGSGGIAYLRYKLIDGPEPGTLPLVAVGLAWLARRRKR